MNEARPSSAQALAEAGKPEASIHKKFVMLPHSVTSSCSFMNHDRFIPVISRIRW